MSAVTNPGTERAHGGPAPTLAGALEAFRRDGQVDRELPGGGRLHLDRAVPFLACHRLDGSPESCHSADLLGALSTLLVVPPTDDGRDQDGADAVARTAEALHAGAQDVLVAELWAVRRPEAPCVTVVAAPSCRLELVETLLKSLKSADWGETEPAVEIRYETAPAPPGQPPARAGAAEAANGAVVGLELNSWYLDADSGAAYPERLRAARRALTLCLRQLAFEWLRESRQLRHHHELGRRVLEDPVAEVDRGLVEIAEAFDVILYLSPVNSAAAWRAFEADGCGSAPRFRYRGVPSDPSRLKQRLYALPVEDIEDPALHELYSERRNDLDRVVTLIRERNTPRFLPSALAVFGPVEPTLLEQAEALLERLPTVRRVEERACDSQAVAEAGRREIAHLAAIDPSFDARVEIREDVPGVMCSGSTLIVGSDTTVAQRRLEALMQHEVGTHLLTAHNGAGQPLRILKVGLANYEELQEGLAVLAEHLSGGLTAARLRLLAARVLAAHAAQEGAGFVDTFRLLRERAMPPRRAFDVAMRIHRGGGYVKDLIYLRGLGRLLRHLSAGGRLEDLLLGKGNFEQIEVLEELRHRRVLKPARLRPRYLDDRRAAARLERLREHGSLLALAEEVT